MRTMSDLQRYPSPDQGWMRYKCFCFLKLITFIYGFLENCQHFLFWIYLKVHLNTIPSFTIIDVKRCDMVSLNMIHILHVLLIKSVSKTECNFKYTSYRLLFIKSESKRDCNFKQSSITEWHVECTNLKTLSDQDERIRYSFLSTLDYFFSIVVSL